VPAVAVEVVSAVGAGDSFMAGVLLTIDALPPGTGADGTKRCCAGLPRPRRRVNSCVPAAWNPSRVTGPARASCAKR
jgi:hypothetical protein